MQFPKFFGFTFIGGVVASMWWAFVIAGVPKELLVSAIVVSFLYVVVNIVLISIDIVEYNKMKKEMADKS